MLTRNQALEIVDQFIDNQNLKKHMLAVEASISFYAKKLGQDEEVWGLTGLLHDADWENYPDQHPKKMVQYLKEKQEELAIPDELIQAIASHGNDPERFTKRESQLDKYLFAVDELSGFVVACALVRPDKLASLKPKSVVKKLKDKAFARQVNREEIYQGAEDLGLDLKEHIANVIAALQGISKELGL